MTGSAFRGHRALGFAACLCLALAACDGNQPRNLGELLSLPPSPPPTAAAAPDAGTFDLPPQTAALSPAPPLARFQDLKATQVEALVGSPDFRRVEPPAELWQYRTANCVVDLFFFGQDGDRHVVRADGRSRDPVRVGEDRCGDGSEVLRTRRRG